MYGHEGFAKIPPRRSKEGGQDVYPHSPTSLAGPMRLLKTFLLFEIFTLCGWTQSLSANQDIFANPGSKKVTALYIKSKIVIDGNLDEPEWTQAQPAKDFI